MVTTWFRRSLREIRQNALRYGAIFLLVAGGLGVVLALITSSDAMITSVNAFRVSAHLEDGEFEARAPLTEAQRRSLEQHGVTLEKQPWVDISGPGDSTVRLQPVRGTINTIQLSDGRLPESSGDIVVEKLYADAHGLVPGSTIELAGKKLMVSGVGSTPDYSYVIPSVASSSTAPGAFGTAFVSVQDFESTATGSLTPTYSYAYQLPDDVSQDQLRSWLLDMKVDPDEISNPALRTRVNKQQEDRQKLINALDGLTEGARTAASMAPSADEALQQVGDANAGLREYVDENAKIEIPILASFQSADTNPRVITVTNDAEVNQTTALFAGFLLLVLAAYMLAAFAIDNLDQDSGSIGALSAMGFRRRELIFQYLLPPLMVVVLACIAGTAGGSFGAQAFNEFAQLTSFYSVPAPEPRIAEVALATGLLAAPLLVAVVIAIQLRRKLSQSPLGLLRKTPDQKVGGRSFSFKGWSFVPRFRVRQALRESRSYVIMLAGLLLAVILMVFGFGMQTSISNYSSRVTEDLKFDYMYTLQVSDTEVPAGAETVLATAMAIGDESQSNVTMLGLPDSSKYFDFDLDGGANTDVAVSEAVANRYGLKVGDPIFLTDRIAAHSYRVVVSQIVPYASGLYIFQPIQANRTLLGQADDYYNAVLSDQSLEFDEGQVEAVITRADIVNGAEKTVEITSPIVITLVALSVVIICIVLALFIRMIVDRDTYSISLMKSFGYRKSEVARLSLNNYALVVVLALLLGIPIGLLVLAPVWRAIIASMPMGAPFLLDVYSVMMIIGIVVVAYTIVYFGARIKLAKVDVTEILKDRE